MVAMAGRNRVRATTYVLNRRVRRIVVPKPTEIVSDNRLGQKQSKSYRFGGGHNLFSVLNHDVNVRVCFGDEYRLCANTPTNINEH